MNSIEFTKLNRRLGICGFAHNQADQISKHFNGADKLTSDNAFEYFTKTSKLKRMGIFIFT